MTIGSAEANEAAIAHFPGLNVVIPSTPEDAAGLMWSAMHGEDPTIVLVPKHMLWAEREVSDDDLAGILDEAYAGFRHKAVAPLIQIGPSDWLLCVP